MKQSSMNPVSRAPPDENLSDPSPHFPGNDPWVGWAEHLNESQRSQVSELMSHPVAVPNWRWLHAAVMPLCCSCLAG